MSMDKVTMDSSQDAREGCFDIDDGGVGGIGSRSKAFTGITVWPGGISGGRRQAPSHKVTASPVLTTEEPDGEGPVVP